MIIMIIFKYEKNEKYLKEDKDNSYLKEYNKYSAIEDLNRIKHYIDHMISLCNLPRKMDKNTKQNIIDMTDFITGIIAYEGKLFLSSEEIYIKNNFHI